MRTRTKSIRVTSEYITKDDGQESINQAFDILFDEVFRLKYQKPIVATK